jgi:hypothetical protein
MHPTMSQPKSHTKRHRTSNNAKPDKLAHQTAMNMHLVVLHVNYPTQPNLTDSHSKQPCIWPNVTHLTDHQRDDRSLAVQAHGRRVCESIKPKFDRLAHQTDMPLVVLHANYPTQSNLTDQYIKQPCIGLNVTHQTNVRRKRC